jgi:N-acetylneuraminic acid mutarotase
MKIKINPPGLARASLLLAILLLAVASTARGQGCPPRGTQYFDGVTLPALPMGWVASQGANVTGAPLWVTSNVASHSWPNDAFSVAPDNILDNRLDTLVFSADPFALGISFWHSYNLEIGRDGAVLEISSPNINGGAFTDITDPAVNGSVTPGYNSLISSAFQSPIAGQMAWSGNSDGYVLTQVRYFNAVLPPSQIRLRFRLVSDNNGASEGWRIDTLTFQSDECNPPTPTPTPCPLQPWTTAANYPLTEISEHALGASGFFAYSAGGYTSSAETNAFYRYEAATDNWAVLPPLPAALARARGVYSFHPNQGGFFVFGGVNQSTVLDTTYFYDVATNTWSTLAPMPAPRYLPNVVSYGSKILVIGGHDGNAETNQTWEYDPEANTWNTGRADIPVAMAGSAASANGQFIYLVSHLNGGAGSNLHYRYDVLFNTWTLMPPAPAALYQPIGATLGGQNVVVGGPNHANAPSGPHTGTYLYDTGHNVWSTGPNTNIGHASAGGASLVGNRLLVVGGHNYASGNTNVAEISVTSCAPTPSPTPTPTPSASISPTGTPTASPPPTATPTITATPTATPAPAPAQALNISTRLRVETGERVMIGGFIVTGSVSKKVAIRGVGPSLANAGLSDALADPTLELRGSNGASLVQNDNWQDDPAQATELTNLGLALTDSRESGIVVTLDPGAYTAIIAGKNQTSGIALVEIYDVDAAAASRLANISTRGFVQTGDNVMIGGFILGNGSGSTTVAVRGIGPSLGQFGLNNVLADPTLELRDSNGDLLIANDNWQDDAASAAQLTAQGLAPQNPLESGIFTTVPPGLFTAILTGKNDGIGLGLVEVYGGLHASTLIVTSTADSGAGSLRQALADTNNGDTIQFAPALNGQTITLTSGELVIDKNITITGPGPNQLAVQRSTASGIPEFRIFHIMPSRTVLIEGLTISNGAAGGGGILNEQATLTLDHCTVSNNIGGFEFSGTSGGGISNFGTGAALTIANSTITGNALLVGNQFNPSGNGAGIYNNGTLAIDHSAVSGNHFAYFINPGPMFGGDGAGIYSVGGTVTISNSTVSGNRANRAAGGIFNGGSLEITNSTISGNGALYSGGGIGNSGTVTISHSTLSGNSAYYKWFGAGGGISNGGTLEIDNSTVSGNSVDGGGGAISNSAGTTTITNSTLTDNFSTHTKTMGGGALRNEGGGTLQLQNTILNASGLGGSINNISATVISHGYNLSSDNGGGFLTGTGDQINTNPMLGALLSHGGPTATHALLTGSPAINAGDPNFTPPPFYDQRGPGYDRVVDGRIDIGSFELQPEQPHP